MRKIFLLLLLIVLVAAPFALKPYGIVVGYSDGHCDYWPLTEMDWKIIDPQTFSLGRADQYMTLYFRAFDDGNFTKVRKAFGINF